jgi:integrase
MRLVKRINKAGSTSWQLDYGMVDGRRKRVSFGANKREAEESLAEVKRSRRKMGDLGVVLSPLEMAEFVSLKAELREVGASMREAVGFFLKHGASLKRPVKVRTAVESFLEAKEETGRALRTVQSYRQTLRSLSRMHGECLVHELTGADVVGWLNAQGWAARSWNGALGFVRTFLAWCMRSAQGYASRNVAVGMEMRPEVVAGEIGTLSLVECEALLSRARAEALERGGVAWKMLAFVVIGLFGGLRRAELERLVREDLNLEEGTVIVRAANAKTRQRRVVELSENARLWLRRPDGDGDGDTLKREQRTSERVCPANLKKLWPVFWRACGLKEWRNNALRHTFASMHLAMHGDEARLQTMMGHESGPMLHRHYKALVTKREAEVFWELKPE